MKRWTRGLDWTNLLIGLWVTAAPWALDTADDGASTWTAVLVGASVALVAVWALAMPSSLVAQWSNLSLGTGLFFAPWLFGYADVSAAAWNAWVAGVAVVAFAAAALPAARRAGAASIAEQRERIAP